MNRNLVGWTSEPRSVPVAEWRVQLFCKAIGDAPPDPNDPVPPTFLKALEGESCSSALILGLLGVPMHSVLHAEQMFELSAPIHVGETVTVQRRISAIEDKKGGALTLIHLDTVYDRDGVQVGLSRQTVLVRQELP